MIHYNHVALVNMDPFFSHLDLTIAIADSQDTALSNPTDTGDVVVTLHLE